MAIQPNRFNDPALGAAFANVASLFAPPSAQDLQGYTAANAKKQEAEQLAWLFANPNDPTASRRASLVGVQDYGQTPDGFTYSVDQNNATARYDIDTDASTALSTNAADNARALEAARIAAQPTVVQSAEAAAIAAENQRLSWLFENAGDPMAATRSSLLGLQEYGNTQPGFAATDATNRRGQDVTAQTSIATNAADNARAVQTNMADNQAGIAKQFMTPQNQGQAQPGLPADVASLFGMPAIGGVAGPAKPLSETEVKGQERMDLRSSGTLTDTMLLDSILGEQAPVKTLGPDGAPIYSTPGAAARTGAQAYVDAGSAPKPENGMAMLPDGRQVPAIQDVTTGRWKHAQTGQDLPADIQVFKTPAPVGTNEQVGVGKPVANNIDRQLIDVAVAKDTAVTLRDMIATSPASQGAVGWLRGTAQNVVQTGGELGTFFGGNIKQVTDAIASGAADASLAGSFDPNIPAIEMMANLLAFQYAKTTTGERLSNEMLAQARRALGLEGLTANQASSLARIDMAIKQMEAQEEILRGIRTNGVGAGQPAPAAPPTVTGAVPEGVDAELWEFMTPEERALWQ